MSSLAITRTDKAPSPIGPYSQAVVAGDLVFNAGQLPINPVTGEVVPGDIKAQTAQALDNHVAVLEASGSDLAHVVKVTVYLLDLGDFGGMNEIYALRFGDHLPARTTIKVDALPRGVRIVIDVIAARR